MSVEVNVIFINGWGGDVTSFELASMREAILAEFGRSIYCPPPVNYTETGLILRYLEDWKDPTIFAALSCGCSTVNAVTAHCPPSERIPYAMMMSPSVWCGLGYVQPVVGKATQVTSWAGDFFNPGGRLIVQRAPDNYITQIDEIKSGYAHGWTPRSPLAQRRLAEEIQLAQKGA